MKRVWSPVAVTASLLCLFTGGFVVARDTAMLAGTQQNRQSARLAIDIQAHHALAPVQIRTPGAGVDGNATETLATASARLKPAAPIPAGRRRGRASTTAAVNTR